MSEKYNFYQKSNPQKKQGNAFAGQDSLKKGRIYEEENGSIITFGRFGEGQSTNFPAVSLAFRKYGH